MSKLLRRTPRYLWAHGEVVGMVFEAGSAPFIWAAIATLFHIVTLLLWSFDAYSMLEPELSPVGTPQA